MKQTIWMRAALVAAFSLALHGSALAAPDAWITTKVKLALLTADGVPGTAINVDTIDGRVTLHGAVPTQVEQARAERVAAGVQGVKSVRNLLTLEAKPEPKRAAVADDTLKAHVSDALRHDAALADSAIEVGAVHDGAVTLRGSARTVSDELRAVETARAVPGVRLVKDDIEAPQAMSDAEVWGRDVAATRKAAATSASDVWLTSAVKVKLIANDQTPGGDINVDSADGVVTLFGMVPSAAAKQAAEATARDTAGVKQVVNALQVVAPAKQEQVKATDEQIEELVETRVDDDVIPHSDIDVQVSGGVVRLTGTVPTQTDRLQALTLARSTAGVRSVVDQLQVAN
ncbi:MAG: BON domain-containing protein [Deltaproteobacteria bacterium]|nr:BON domain-containing protein [Deltaproteobacteria bacterium]